MKAISVICPYILSGICLIGGTFAGQNLMAQPSKKIQKNPIIKKSDPRWDPNWDWTQNSIYTLYIRSDIGENEVDVRLPYYSDDGPAHDDFNNDEPGYRDIYPEDGWVCILRDFGSPDLHRYIPYFILYNRFKGTLRLFYYCPDEKGSYSVVFLRNQIPDSQPYGLFTFMQSEHMFLEDYDPNAMLIFIGKLHKSVWNYADFSVVGYEPNLPENAKFVFDIFGVAAQEIELTGSGIGGFTGTLEASNIGSTDDKIGDFIKLAEKAWKSFKDAKKLVDEIEKFFGSRNTGRLNSTRTFGLAEAVAIIAGAATLIDGFIADEHNENSVQILNLKGNMDFEFEGTIKTTLPVVTFSVRVPGAHHTGDDNVPFYDEPLGIFNLRYRPTTKLHEDVCNTQSAIFRVDDFPLEVNPSISQYVKIETALTLSPPPHFKETVTNYVAVYPAPESPLQMYGNGNWCGGLGSGTMVVRVTITPQDKPITLIKAYPCSGLWPPVLTCLESWRADCIPPVDPDDPIFVDTQEIHTKAALLGLTEVLKGWNFLSNIALVDFNGDGQTDIFTLTDERWLVAFSGKHQLQEINKFSKNLSSFAFYDFDGNGKTDIFQISGRDWLVSFDGSSNWRRINSLGGNMGQFGFGDFNGDGKTDIFRISGKEWQTSFGGATSWKRLNKLGGNLSNLVFGDFNGDKKTDIVQFSTMGFLISYQGTAKWQPLGIPITGHSIAEFAFRDFNGDGKCDIFHADGTGWSICFWGKLVWERINNSTLKLEDLRFGDFNGDGVTDVLLKTGEWNEVIKK